MVSLQEETVPQVQKNVLCVGLTVIDLITTVEQFPEEDSDQRGCGFRKQRGGNASNSCTILRQLNTPCEYLGVLPGPPDPEHRWLQEDFSKHGIHTTGCVYSDRPCPMATVLVSRQNGSRTIVYCDNGHPELTYQQFVSAVMDRILTFSWVHFEMRPNVEDCVRMMRTVMEKRQSQQSNVDHLEGHVLLPRISVEIEKPEFVNAEQALALALADVVFISKDWAQSQGWTDMHTQSHTHKQAMALADVVFLSKDWARSRGWTDMHTAVRHASKLCGPHTVVVCPWAETGAAAGSNDSIVTTVTASAPGPVVDTLGAGDTLVGAFLHACVDGHPLPRALHFACRLAAFKCTREGFEGLSDFRHRFIEGVE
ncbi:hypothetical protein ACOMHN_022168 [Nucella lapillus]